MSTNLVLAIDQGTTGTTVLIIDFGQSSGKSGTGLQILGRGYAALPQHFPQPGYVEHDLEEIWHSTLAAMKEALAASNITGNDIQAIGLTNQRETTCLWYHDGRPACRAMVWQDRRTADRCQALINAGHEELIQSRSGLVVDPYFSGTKLGWLLDSDRELRDAAQTGRLRFGTVDSWLLWKLSGGLHATDISNASRTLIFDIHRRVWDDELCSLMGLSETKSLLPEVVPSSGEIAKTSGVDILPDGIPIAGIAGDQQAAMFGQGCFMPGMAKCTYGTGAFALINTGNTPRRSHNNLLTTILWGINNEIFYAIEGSVFVAGAIVQWLRDGLGIITNSQEIETLAREVEDVDGVVVVPALTGLGAPHWRPDVRGAIVGLTRGSTRAHIARAALEGIAFQVADLADAMVADSGTQLEILRVDGGAAANDLLMQFQADLLGVEIHRPEILETTAVGAASLAALGVGLVNNCEELADLWRCQRVFKRQTTVTNVALHRERWQDGVDLVCGRVGHGRLSAEC